MTTSDLHFVVTTWVYRCISPFPPPSSSLSLPPSQVVHTSLQAMVPQARPSEPELMKPDDEEVEKTTEETRQALEKLVQKKTSAALPVRAAEKTAPAQYIRYVFVYTCVLCTITTTVGLSCSAYINLSFALRTTCPVSSLDFCYARQTWITSIRFNLCIHVHMYMYMLQTSSESSEC